MKLKTLILAALLTYITDSSQAGKTSFYNKLEKQNQRNLKKYNQKNKKIKKVDHDISTLLFLSAFCSYMQMNTKTNSLIKDQEAEEFINEFNSTLTDQHEKKTQEDETNPINFILKNDEILE